MNQRTSRLLNKQLIVVALMLAGAWGIVKLSGESFISAQGTCVTATAGGAWQNRSFTSQTGAFTAVFDANPSASPVNAVVGLSNGAAAAYTSLAAVARFNPTGQIDARNGGAYAAASTISYSANVNYRFRMVVNVAAHTYSIFVTPAGGAEQTVGLNYAFRTEQSSVTSLNNYGVFLNTSPAGSVTVCNFAVGQTPAITTHPANQTVNPGQPATFSVAASGTAPLSYQWQRNGANISGATSASYTFTAAAADDGALYRCVVTNAAGSATSNAAMLTVNVSPSCVTATSGGAWLNTPFISQNGTFTAEFDATPSASPINAVVGLSRGAQSAYTGFAAMPRFNPTGQIDARNGGAFAAASAIPYSANVTYHFRLVVNVPARAYSTFVRPAGGAEQLVGSNYAFRTEQNTVTSLDSWGSFVNASNPGSLTTCNFTISSAPPSCNIAGSSALWNNFVNATEAGNEPTLPDFSYAGYRYSDEPIPNVSGPIFRVTDYGAVANDSGYDDAGIQAAIDAAESAGGGVVLFPAGQFRVNPTEDSNHFITIQGSNIVLRGAGSGAGGTEILMVAKKQGGSMFRIAPTSWGATTVANITADATRETFWVTVDSAAQLSVGQRVIIRYQSTEYNNFYHNGLPLDPDWPRVVTNGVGIHEAHVIAQIQGNQARFREPLHFNLMMGSVAHRLEAVNPLVEVGIEDIRFTGSWDTYPETFVHHKDWIHDSGWSLMSVKQVANGWVRRCEFRHFNTALTSDTAIAFTIENVKFTGKKGHTSVGGRRGYGLLVKDCEDTASTHHGPDTGYNAVATVYLRHIMQSNQQIDSHGGVPHATLFDQITGGVLYGNGGPIDNYPHHGRYMTFWNFAHRSSSSRSYDFWDAVNRNSHTFTLPIFAGFTANTSVTFQSQSTEIQVNESFGTPVTPVSLFEAQLQLRHCRQGN
jgi:Domain of unknown function (DUF4955)/Immunoglobulin domain/Pectate lyase superfamily protein